jgi:hypothetical protein
MTSFPDSSLMRRESVTIGLEIPGHGLAAGDSDKELGLSQTPDFVGFRDLPPPFEGPASDREDGARASLRNTFYVFIYVLKNIFMGVNYIHIFLYETRIVFGNRPTYEYGSRDCI